MKKLILSSLFFGALLTTAASAQTVTKADNVNSLNLGSSYIGGVVPTETDTLIITNTLTTGRTAPVGGNISVLGITMSATKQFQVSATTNSTLTIFGGGITKDANTAPLILASAVALGADQTWILNASSGSGTGNFQLFNTVSFDAAGHSLAINGGGILDLRPGGSLTLGPTVTIDTRVSVNRATGVVTFGGANTFNQIDIVAGKASGATFGNFGVASNFGDGGTNTVIGLGFTNNSGTFEYTGATTSSNRTFNMDRRSNGNSILVTNAASTLTISGNISTSLGNATGEKNVNLTIGGAGNTTLDGNVLNHAGASNTGLVKEDAGTLTLGAANGFLGGLTIAAGTVTISANERIANANKLTLNGGNFNVSTFTETMGILSVGSSNGTLTLGLGGVLVFNNSSAEAWTGSLSIAGDFVSGSSIRFGTTNGGLIGSQLSAISVVGFEGIGIDDSGFLTATVIPEPSTWALFAVAGMLLMAARRRCRARP